MIIVPYRLTRTYLEQHQELTFIYSCSVAGNDPQGHLIVAHNLPNCYPIYTKRDWCHQKDSYWCDEQFSSLIKLINSCLDKVPKNLPIIPFPSIGRGCSELRIRAPALLSFIESGIERIACKEFKRQTVDGRLI